MPQETPLYQYGGFKVWANRVEQTQGCLFMKQTKVFPIRKISSVEASTATNKLTLTMDDGKRHTFHVMSVDKARNAILNAM